MYLRILKRDLKRKKTMNIILLIFIILAATFIASSANNMISVATALDNYFEKAGIPDYWFSTSDKNELERYKTFAEENNYSYNFSERKQIDPNNVFIDGVKLDYSNSVGISSLDKDTKVFDSEDEEITHINDGEIYLTAKIFYSDKNDFQVGGEIELIIDGKSKTFTIKGSTKDAMFGSSMIGITRFLISDNDYEYFTNDKSTIYYCVGTYTDDADYEQKFMNLDINTLFNVNYATVKLMYVMDMIIAAVMLIVSICLILISMVILRFTINFTMSEEFREIGVMKALGLKSNKIRVLYIIKYLAISVVGASMGFALSIPFGEMMIRDVSQNIIISNDSSIFLNLICCVATAAIVVMFCYICTGKINKFSPIDAIRNGQSGERFSRKSILSLNNSRLAPVPFMALNDILSGLKRFIAMVLIFTLGLLLIIIPVNTINTLQSDKLIRWFNMADCDHVVSQELLFTSSPDNETLIRENIDHVKEIIDENNIAADIFQEVMYRMTVTFDGKKSSSLAFQGIGDVTTDHYTYLEGTAPQNSNEVALTVKTADSIKAKIGDEVEIKNGTQTKKYIITAIFQSMNNLGEGIRFHQDEKLDYSYAAGSFGVQIKYTDNPDKEALKERKTLLKESLPEGNIYTAGEYINFMIGDVAGQLGGIKQLIILVVICINILVTVLMVRSFIAKEKGEIAMLKAIGFRNHSLVAWQSMRIVIVLIISVILATALSTPLSQLTVGPIFQMMGAQSIEFEILPLEVFVLYPLIVLCATVFSGMLAALQLKKINASETSNIE